MPINRLSACFCMGRYLCFEPILPSATRFHALWRSTCKPWYCKDKAFAFLGGLGVCFPGEFWGVKLSNMHFFNVCIHSKTHSCRDHSLSNSLPFSPNKDRRTDSRIRRKKHNIAPLGIEPRVFRLSVLLSLLEKRADLCSLFVTIHSKKKKPNNILVQAFLWSKKWCLPHTHLLRQAHDELGQHSLIDE